MARKVSRVDWKQIRMFGNAKDSSYEFSDIKFGTSDNKKKIIDEVMQSESYEDYVGLSSIIESLEEDLDEVRSELGHYAEARHNPLHFRDLPYKLVHFEDNLKFLNMLFGIQLLFNWLIFVKIMNIGLLWLIVGGVVALWAERKLINWSFDPKRAPIDMLDESTLESLYGKDSQ